MLKFSKNFDVSRVVQMVCKSEKFTQENKQLPFSLPQFKFGEFLLNDDLKVN